MKGKARKDASASDKLGFKDYLGTAAMTCTDGIGSGLMTSWFMVYLTDYAGIGPWAAALGTGLLLFARIFDAVNDPFEGWIMDRAKVGRMGKYKPFIILAIILMSIGVSALFFVPSLDNPILIGAWVIISYLIYDIGVSFFAPNLVYRTLTLDPNARGRLMIAPRIIGVLMGLVTSSIIVIVNGVNASINDLHLSFGIAVLLIMVITGAISLFGISLIKERITLMKAKRESAYA